MVTIHKPPLNSKYTLCHFPQKKTPSIYLNIYNTPVKCIGNLNVLDLTINIRLTWNNHIDKIASKISHIVGMINNLKGSFLRTHYKKYAIR